MEEGRNAFFYLQNYCMHTIPSTDMHMAPQKYEETASLKIFVDRGQESQFEKGAFAELLPWILKESLYRRVRTADEGFA